MGLFKNDKKPCPICGKPTPRLFPTEVEGMPICSDCNSKSHVKADIFNSMTIQDFSEHLAFREQNAERFKDFVKSAEYDFSFLSDEILIDEENMQWCVKNCTNPAIHSFDDVISISLYEDKNLVISADESGVFQGESIVPTFVKRFSTVSGVQSFTHAIDALDGQIDGNYSSQRIDEPFDNFHIVIKVDDPYWDEYDVCIGGPNVLNLSNTSTYRHTDPVAEYESDYINQRSEIDTFMEHFISMAFANASLEDEAQPQAQGNEADTTEQIKKFKELLDIGAITQDEFDAKKKQLLKI